VKHELGGVKRFFEIYLAGELGGRTCGSLETGVWGCEAHAVGGRILSGRIPANRIPGGRILGGRIPAKRRTAWPGFGGLGWG